MAFHFSLETVLHLRQAIERQQQLRLRAANQQVARMRHLIEQIDRCTLDLRRQQAQQLSSGTTIAELRFAERRAETLAALRQNATLELSRLEQHRDQQQRVFQQARRERETVESLRARRLREHDRNSSRRQQRQLDEIFLLRQAYLRRG
jgi:flagellar export protein FliJ